MAEINPPLYVDQDDAYGAPELGLPFRDLIGEGVVGLAAGELLVTQDTGANLKTSVAAGACWISGDDDANAQPHYRCRNDAPVLLQHDAADATNPRIDLVIAEVLDATFAGTSKLWRLRIVKGTPAGAPVAPATPSDAIALAEVTIDAGSGAITNANIADKRTSALIGGGAADVNLNGVIQTYTVIDDYTVAGAAIASYDTNARLGGSIPQTYKHLKLLLDLRSDNATAGAAIIRFNGDSGANYDWAVGNGATGAGPVTGGAVGGTLSTAQATGNFAEGEVFIPFYAESGTRWKGAGGRILADDGSTYAAQNVNTRWKSTAAIERIQLFPTGTLGATAAANIAGNFVDGCRFVLLGVTY